MQLAVAKAKIIVHLFIPLKILLSLNIHVNTGEKSDFGDSVPSYILSGDVKLSSINPQKLQLGHRRSIQMENI
jgi:hypothetical protein